MQVSVAGKCKTSHAGTLSERGAALCDGGLA